MPDPESSNENQGHMTAGTQVPRNTTPDPESSNENRGAMIEHEQPSEEVRGEGAPTNIVAGDAGPNREISTGDVGQGGERGV